MEQGECLRFINHNFLIDDLHPHRYMDKYHWVSVVGILLSRPLTHVPFTPLVETSLPFLETFPKFLANLEATFGEIGRR